MAGEDEKKRTVVVTSRLRNAVSLRVDEMVGVDTHGQIGYAAAAPGEKMARQKGDRIELRPGRNEVDADFWREWQAQNKDGELAKHLDPESEKTEQ